jgi:hypothetical protein
MSERAQIKRLDLILKIAVSLGGLAFLSMSSAVWVPIDERVVWGLPLSRFYCS